MAGRPGPGGLCSLLVDPRRGYGRQGETAPLPLIGQHIHALLGKNNLPTAERKNPELGSFFPFQLQLVTGRQ